MPEEKLQTLSLQVINGSELESGRAARCLFTQQGNVGHGPECHWSVQDRQQSIPAQAFTVILHDGTFCLRPQTAQLWLNQAKVTATSDLIQLRQGDEIQIGRLMVRVHLNRGDIPHYDEEMATPETIVTNRDMLTDTLLSTEGAPHYPGMTHRHQLADTVVNGFSADPLQALQSESLITTGDPLSGIAAVRPSAPLSDPASNGGINTPFMDLPPIYASPGDRNDDVSAAEMAQRHLAVTPLLRGLGGSLTMSNSDDADDFLEEAGRTLQAAIKGLLDLQQQRNSLSDKHLRPLEDNPLRLNMDYATALDVMFAEGKSPVHLAAPAAVSESLRNVRHHEEANRAAIVESLRVLLDAFSPQNLLRRFVQYRRSHELRQPLDDAGAWQMYSHYYEELASDRQQGFEMLFNEVYAQVYDRVLREKQRETGMQMMRVADSRWPESLQQQQASTQWNEALKTRAQSSPQLRGWLQTRQDLHAFADLVMQREKEGLTLSYIKNVIWQAERGLGQETPVESLLTQYHDARAQKQNTDALEKQINERLEGVLSRWLLLKNNVMPEAATGTTAEK
ncbi:TPA: type VI secretion system-associated FHA domain protein TagH [Escherichia coli]|nr:type VI secretion system-associated FHA domain protein TagH [Escherichia coli]